MLAKSLSVVFLATLVVAEIPSYFPICGRRNPHLDKCVLEATDELRDKLKEGIPELGIPALEPLLLEGFSLSNTDTLKASAHNIKISGIGDFETRSNHIDFENQTFHAVRYWKKLTLDADYDINAKIVVPIVGHGPIHVVTEDVVSDTTLKYKMIKKNGKDYIFYTSMTTKISIKDFTTDFKPMDGTDGTLATAVNTALQGAKQEIFETIKPNLEKIISEVVLNLGNKISAHLTFDETFPDRE